MNTNLFKNIKLQIVCLAYNQAEFIRDALDGFVMQKTNFPFEVLIGDDCSTDGTSEIIAEYAQKYPHIIKHFKRKKNMGSQQNSFDLLKHVDADYLALCEGDDYWTDENKLQLQVDLLENNRQLNGCFHKAEIIKEKNVTSWNSDKYFPKDENGRQFWPTNLKKEIVKMADVLPGIIATSSIVYRYDKNFKYPEWFRTCIAGDRPMHCFMIKDGSFQYIDKVMSVYRISKKGVWFNKNNENNLVEETQSWVDLLNNLDDFFHKKFACIDFYRNETIKKAIRDSFEKQNTENLSKLMNIFKKHFLKMSNMLAANSILNI